MLIPYFYLKVGKIQIIQPQNIETKFKYNKVINNKTFAIASISCPEHNTYCLFVNGDIPEKSFNMLEVGKYGEDFISAIKLINNHE
jgi:hypothetical protein